VEAYEELRRQAVEPDGRGVLIRRGLATWAQLRPPALSVRPPESHSPSKSDAPALDPFGSELVRLLAGLILSTRQESFLHA
jgi:hypothetical protein